MTAPRKTGRTGSRNPAGRPTSVAAWKKSSVAPPIQLPSGNFMRVKKVGLQTLMQIGIMPNSLMAFAMKAVGKGTGKPEEMSAEEMAEIANDPKKIQEVSEFMSRMVMFVAQEPEVYPIPESLADGSPGVRDEELLYIDEIDDDDKMFIFQVVTGGTTNLETFRAEHSSSLAAIRGREDLELPS